MSLASVLVRLENKLTQGLQLKFWDWGSQRNKEQQLREAGIINKETVARMKALAEAGENAKKAKREKLGAEEKQRKLRKIYNKEKD